MGLDWILVKRKARPGQEARFAELEVMFDRMRADHVSPVGEVQEEYESISLSCFEVIGAPRIGLDEEATEFFRTKVYEPARREALETDPDARVGALQSFDEALEEARGKYVVELAKEKDGLAPITGMAASSLDFRGKVVATCPFLPPSLKEEAFQDHTAEQCLIYAQQLELEADRVARTPLARAPEANRSLMAVKSAIKWLRFWGSRGFGYYAWA